MNDPFDDIIDNHDIWVVEPTPEIQHVIGAVLNADAGLSEEYD